jgi:hypothetical protein
MARTETADPENWEKQIRKGWLELAILASLRDDRLYGLEILRRLETHSDLVLAEGTIYPILNRLKRDGLIESRWVESEAGHPVLLADRPGAARHGDGPLCLDVWPDRSADRALLGKEEK